MDLNTFLSRLKINVLGFQLINPKNRPQMHNQPPLWILFIQLDSNHCIHLIRF